jgi:hypothetical protein
MLKASYKRYSTYQDLIPDILFNVIEDGMVAVIVNYKDCSKLLSALFENTVNGNSLYLSCDYKDRLDEDVITAQMNDGNMLVTIRDTGEIITEAVVFITPEAFSPMTYLVEYGAKGADEYPLQGLVVPFMIET